MSEKDYVRINKEYLLRYNKVDSVILSMIEDNGGVIESSPKDMFDAIGIFNIEKVYKSISYLKKKGCISVEDIGHNRRRYRLINRNGTPKKSRKERIFDSLSDDVKNHVLELRRIREEKMKKICGEMKK